MSITSPSTASSIASWIDVYGEPPQPMSRVRNERDGPASGAGSSAQAAASTQHGTRERTMGTSGSSPSPATVAPGSEPRPDRVVREVGRPDDERDVRGR